LTLNLVFHVASAGCGLWAGWYLLKLKRNLDFSRTMWRLASGLDSGRVIVTWLPHFLGMMQSNFGIQCDIGSLPKDPPIRILPGDWVAFHTQVGIKEISWTIERPDDLLIVSVRCCDAKEDADWESLLRKSLSNRFNVVIKEV